MKKSLKNNRGITLIALVITIIILLILAAVSISMVFNGDGLFSKAEESALEHRAGKVEDEVAIWKNDKQLANYSQIKDNIKLRDELINDQKARNLLTEKEANTAKNTGKVKIGSKTIDYGEDDYKINVIYDKIPISLQNNEQIDCMVLKFHMEEEKISVEDMANRILQKAKTLNDNELKQAFEKIIQGSSYMESEPEFEEIYNIIKNYNGNNIDEIINEILKIDDINIEELVSYGLSEKQVIILNLDSLKMQYELTQGANGSSSIITGEHYSIDIDSNQIIVFKEPCEVIPPHNIGVLGNDYYFIVENGVYEFTIRLPEKNKDINYKVNIKEMTGDKTFGSEYEIVSKDNPEGAGLVLGLKDTNLMKYVTFGAYSYNFLECHEPFIDNTVNSSEKKIFSPEDSDYLDTYSVIRVASIGFGRHQKLAILENNNKLCAIIYIPFS